jgi:hypothetical protein
VQLCSPSSPTGSDLATMWSFANMRPVLVPLDPNTLVAASDRRCRQARRGQHYSTYATYATLRYETRIVRHTKSRVQTWIVDQHHFIKPNHTGTSGQSTLDSSPGGLGQTSTTSTPLEWRLICELIWTSPCSLCLE